MKIYSTILVIILSVWSIQTMSGEISGDTIAVETSLSGDTVDLGMPITASKLAATSSNISYEGIWSGRMIYDRGYVGGGTCYDADVTIRINIYQNRDDSISSITIRRDVGGMDIYNYTLGIYRIEDGHLAANFTAFGIKTNFTLEFNPLGYAEGEWVESNGDCYGTFSLAKESQTITFNPLIDKTFGDLPFTVSATASSGLPVSFTSDTTDTCTVSGDSVTLTGAGSCTIRASQSGDSIYAPAPDVLQSFIVAKADQSINFDSLVDKTLDNPIFAIGATTTSGLSVSFTSDTTGVCTVSSSTVTLVTEGTCTIRASQAGDGNYNPAPDEFQSFTVSKASQSITFNPLFDKTLGDPPFTISATASSGLPVSFASDSTSVCTVSGNLVTLIADGTCTIRASQSGDSIYAPAPDVLQSFIVAKADQRALDISVRGGGSVYISPPGVVCSDDCSETFDDDFTVALTAILDPWWTDGSQLWSGDCSGGGTVCLVPMDANKLVSVTFHCELIQIPKFDQVNTFYQWQCAKLEAKEGFEIIGPDGDVTFEASTGIELGAGFSVGEQASFRAVIAP